VESLENRIVPASMTQSAVFAPALTDWHANVGNFSRFNSSLGTLTGVVVTESASMNLSGNGNKITSISDGVKVSAALPNGKALNDNLSVSAGSGPWNLSNSATTSATYTLATDLAAFTGAGSFTVPASTLTTLSYTARGGNSRLNTTTTAGVTVTIQYNYTPTPTSTQPVTNAAPTVATAAHASPNPVIGTTTNLGVLGADDGGASNLTYTWTGP
jgi:hypothetical protein